MSLDPVLACADQREYPRVPLILPATLMVADRDGLACMVTDISAGGAGLEYPGAAPEGECVARLVIEEFGTFQGITARDSGNRRALRFVKGEAERNKLHIKLTLYVEEGLAEIPRDGHWPTEARLSLTRTSGIQEKCDVLGISLKGLTLATEQRPPVGELVRLGRMYGRVMQHLENGIAVSFLSFVSPDQDSFATAQPVAG